MGPFPVRRATWPSDRCLHSRRMYTRGSAGAGAGWFWHLSRPRVGVLRRLVIRTWQDGIAALSLEWTPLVPGCVCLATSTVILHESVELVSCFRIGGNLLTMSCEIAVCLEKLSRSTRRTLKTYPLPPPGVKRNTTLAFRDIPQPPCAYSDSDPVRRRRSNTKHKLETVLNAMTVISYLGPPAKISPPHRAASRSALNVRPPLQGAPSINLSPS